MGRLGAILDASGAVFGRRSPKRREREHLSNTKATLMNFASSGPPGEPLGAILGRIGALLSGLEAICGRPGATLGRPAVLEASWANLGASWRHLGLILR